jgi:iron complex outermembrane recepter protein
MMMTGFRLLSLVSVSAAALLGGAPVFAQSISAADEVSANDIVVTAQRRAQSLQDVPISITAIGGDTLRNSGITRTDDLQFAVPSLTLLANNTPQGTLSLIRGVGTFSYSDAVESSVGTVVDGVVLGRQGMGLINMFDVERVEVLKGPQGTLFGKNASAGLISITTKKPSANFGAEAEFSYGNYNEVLANAAITGPISDSISFRITGHYNIRDGFVQQPALGSTLGNIDRKGVRGKLLIEPAGSSGSLLLSAEYYEVDERCCAFTIRTIGSPTQAFLLGLAGVTPAQVGPNNRISAAETPSFNKSKIFAASAEANLDIGDLAFTSITGYRNWTNRNNSESDGSPVPILGAPGPGQLARYNQFSQELRLSSPDTGNFYYTAGLYYYLIDTKSDGSVQGNLGLAPPTIPAGFLFSSTINSSSTNQNIAAFGELSFRTTPKLLVTVGGRILHERLEAQFARTGNFPLAGTTLGDNTARSGTQSDTNFVARGVAQYDWSDDVMTYVSIARGYKGFGADTSSPLPNLPVNGYAASFAKPETNINYELGIKSRLLNRRLTFNASLFWTDFKNFQVSTFDPTVAQFVLLNAARYRTRGVEADFSLRVARGFTLSGGGAYVDAQPRSFPNVTCSPTDGAPLPCIGGFRDITGKRAPLSPKWAFNVAADFETPLSGSVGLFGRADYSWKSSILYNLDQDPAKIQSPFGVLNARLGLSLGTGDRQIRIAAYARNLLDKTYTNLIFGTPVFGGYAQYPEIGRTYGAQISAKF